MSAPTRAQVDTAVERLTSEVAACADAGQATGALFRSVDAVNALLSDVFVALAQARADSVVLTRLRDAVSHDDITDIEKAMDHALGDPFGGTTCDALRAALDAARESGA